MKYISSVATSFYKNNGVLGICLDKIVQLRAGVEDFGKILDTEVDPQTFPSTSGTSGISQTKHWLDDLLQDERLSDEQRRAFRAVREDRMFDDSEKLRNDRLLESILAKAKHPVYIQ